MPQTVVQLLSANISYRDIYNQLWSNRDFEIAHVWQRAIFLTAFLIACFAGYGGLVVAIATSEKMTIPLEIANGAAFSIAFIGLVISLLWIMMAKGSKMWYENYEEAINAFRANYASKAFDKDVAEIAGMCLHDIAGYIPPDTSDWLWSTAGGKFSVSRINIFVGQLSFLIWMVLLIVHISIADSLAGATMSELWVKSFFTNWKLMSMAVVVLLMVFWLFAHFSLKSRV